MLRSWRKALQFTAESRDFDEDSSSNILPPRLMIIASATEITHRSPLNYLTYSYIFDFLFTCLLTSVFRVWASSPNESPKQSASARALSCDIAWLSRSRFWLTLEIFRPRPHGLNVGQPRLNLVCQSQLLARQMKSSPTAVVFTKCGRRHLVSVCPFAALRLEAAAVHHSLGQPLEMQLL
jgi:hypothetical protein